MSLKENAIDYCIIVFLQFRPDYYVLTHTCFKADEVGGEYWLS
jgi:hypothetical protein